VYEERIGFSRAVAVGNRVLVAGTAPVMADGSCPDGARAQAERCFEIIGLALGQLGASLSQVVRTRMYLVDPDDADEVGAAHREIFQEIRPAATMVVVAGLLDPRWRVEIEAEAAIAGVTS
jgi:enamine deaminase RidA (YjgF/YER057c/UK114 family)